VTFPQAVYKKAC